MGCVLWTIVVPAHPMRIALRLRPVYLPTITTRLVGNASLCSAQLVLMSHDMWHTTVHVHISVAHLRWQTVQVCPKRMRTFYPATNSMFTSHPHIISYNMSPSCITLAPTRHIAWSDRSLPRAWWCNTVLGKTI
eukprot:4946310-Amphidinium_carterae.1